MRRISTLLVAMLLMAAMLAVMALPALADHPRDCPVGFHPEVNKGQLVKCDPTPGAQRP
jgi:hypothetical protein